MGYIEILRPGMGCSVQDKGRYGYMSEGIPVSGAMDQHLAGLANMLVNNTSNEALIEWKLLPPRVKFSVDSNISVVGAGVRVFLNRHEIATHKAISVRKGDILNLKLSRVSGYGYMAVSGGFQSNKVLGSRSFYPKITAYAFLEKGMKLPIVTTIQSKVTEDKQASIKPILLQGEVVQLEVFKGPEFKLLSPKALNEIDKKLFSVYHQSNRMGFLLNENISEHSQSILSSPVLPGTVQWTPSGQLIILMRDAQTVGGYPRIFQLKEAIISKLARVEPNGFVKFIMSK